MIEENRDAEGWVAHCDYCSHIEEFEEAKTFFDAVGQLKELDWSITRTGSVWKHKCPDCQKPKKT